MKGVTSFLNPGAAESSELGTGDDIPLPEPFWRFNPVEKHGTEPAAAYCLVTNKSSLETFI